MLLMVTANDIDIEPTLTYDLLTSTEMFAVDKYSGKLSLTGKLDYETRTSHNLTLMVGIWDFVIVISVHYCTYITLLFLFAVPVSVHWFTYNVNVAECLPFSSLVILFKTFKPYTASTSDLADISH